MPKAGRKLKTPRKNNLTRVFLVIREHKSGQQLSAHKTLEEARDHILWVINDHRMMIWHVSAERYDGLAEAIEKRNVEQAIEIWQDTLEDEHFEIKELPIT